MSGPFKTSQACEILAIPKRRLQSYARRGWVRPDKTPQGQYLFSFHDLLILKTTRNLLAEGVPARRISRVLASLRRQLASGKDLTSLQIYSDGNRIVVWDGAARWQPDSGQFLFSFDTQSLGRTGAPKNHNRSRFSAIDWYHVGLELDDSSPEEAIHAYMEALRVDPTLADAHVNLGRILHRQKKFDEAESHYRQARELAPQDAVAAFNLGVLLHETDRFAEAMEAYSRAIAMDPKLPDAHYNLALLFDRQGEKQQVLRHLHEFEILTRRRQRRSDPKGRGGK